MQMILLTKFNTKDFPGGSDGKTFVYNVGDPGSIPGLGRSPGEGNGNPLQYYCLVKSRVQRILVGYRPWDRKESDMTERLHFHFPLRIPSLGGASSLSPAFSVLFWLPPLTLSLPGARIDSLILNMCIYSL